MFCYILVIDKVYSFILPDYTRRRVLCLVVFGGLREGGRREVSVRLPTRARVLVTELKTS